MNRRRVLQALGYVLLAGMAAIAVVQPDVREAISGLSLAEFLILLLVAAVGVASLGMQFKYAAAVQGANLNAEEWLGLTALNTLISLLVPARAGLAVRAVYMKAIHQMTVRSYVALTAASLGSVVLLASAIGSSLASNLPSGSRAVGLSIFAGLGLSVVILLVLVLGATVPDVPVIRRLRGLRVVLRPYLSPERDPLMVLIWSVGFFLVQAGGTYLAFRAAGATISLKEALLIHSAATISFLVAITPGGLGIKEGVVVFVSSALGVETEISLAAALLDRAVVLLATVLIALAAGRKLLPKALAIDKRGHGSD